MDDTVNPPTDKLVKAYIKMRDARSALKAEYENHDEQIKDQMEIIESHLLELCKATGASSIKTPAGTIIRGIATRYWTSDWESMYNFIKENNSPELLERRIAQTNMSTFLKNNPDKLPKGMNVDSRYTVTIRRSN